LPWRKWFWRKWFFFDPGVKRAMEGLLNVPVVSGTFGYGRAFEHFLLCECYRLNSYGVKNGASQFKKVVEG
jgi:hypothetical protein